MTMTEQRTPIQTLASRLYGAFETAQREKPNEYGSTDYLRTRDDLAPELRELANECTRYAHDDGDNAGPMMPDDWRYAVIHSALSHFTDCDSSTQDDCRNEFADGEVDTYNSTRCAWLGSHSWRPGYVDEACDEMGWPSEADGGVLKAIAYGQYREAEIVFDRVFEFLTENADEVDEG